MKTVLLLEDNPNDVERVLNILRDFVLVSVVTNRNTFIVALVENRFDLIIVDLCVPTFLEFETVKLSRNKQPNTPLIVLTGSMSDDQAAQVLNLGASDYIMKDRPARLIDAIKNIFK